MFGIQVKTWNPAICDYVWIDVRPAGGSPYRFNTEREAERIKYMCYPEATTDWVRIVSVQSQGE